MTMGLGRITSGGGGILSEMVPRRQQPQPPPRLAGASSFPGHPGPGFPSFRTSKKESCGFGNLLSWMTNSIPALECMASCGKFPGNGGLETGPWADEQRATGLKFLLPIPVFYLQGTCAHLGMLPRARVCQPGLQSQPWLRDPTA